MGLMFYVAHSTCRRSMPVCRCGAEREYTAAAACCPLPAGTNLPPRDKTQPKQRQNINRMFNSRYSITL